MFNIDGTLTIGFTYPNMYMGEDYNSPQSPYWAMKSFLALGLPSAHPFWTAEEKPLPSSVKHTVVELKSPMHILSSQPNHHFLLSMGQFCPWPLKATEAKYGKYAYSSHFGFSVLTGTLIQQIAPDSTLALSKDRGETWRVPWKATNPQFSSAQLMHMGEVTEDIPSLTSTWKPWADAEIIVQTHLIAPCPRWSDWYIRWHSIANMSSQDINLQAVQGGFAIQGRGSKFGEVLPSFTGMSGFEATSQERPFPEGTFTEYGSTIICSDAGASGVHSLHLPGRRAHQPTKETPEVLKPDANTNLMWQRTLIPTIKIEEAIVSFTKPLEFGSAVFALARTLDREKRYTGLDVANLWMDAPVVCSGNEKSDAEWYIRFA